ncbi:3-hydroxybutyrate dehydrogenase [Alicyclobacillus sp. TC]|uniref:3-hydroxybutyrate dehydrogenase n=2 Tax=Alicyclobacillus tolerans TaxID=90970 RepID=A0ABT9LZ16_9BACL|nr:MULTISPECIES: 3-hydroxybutyrate dehydrogenase [Alicyclobacillus]MDP9729520.1 3-hydroxybutyrate dehydrogenase [Alicyclobacillus tengchongensis]QRF22743.1 3-hydroxybutyrate dehydrogenase [Alicyclobacillus sp. TC]SHK19903.1 3-hydroxybutyrate dehydrogenase [Alicyclobacillus montanus]
MLSLSLANRTAVVTGSASGIGFAIAQRLAEAGAKVVVSDIRKEAADVAVSQLQKRGLEAICFQADAGAENDVKCLLEFAVHSYGSLDILVNNAGMQYVANIEEFPADKFQQLLQLMLVGPFLSIKYAFPYMKERQWGRIINIASINGLIGFAGKAAYNSAKHGVIGLTKVAALEGAEHGITVNALCPGYVDTPLVRNQLKDLAIQRGVPLESVLEEVIYPLVPQKRLLETSEIADYVLFLASHTGRSITGQAVVIDGGYIAQ